MIIIALDSDYRKYDLESAEENIVRCPDITVTVRIFITKFESFMFTGRCSGRNRCSPNVIGFLGGSENPVPLRQSEVNRILGTVDELQEGGEELSVPYTVGETVKVTVGPFSGFSGLIEEVNSEKRKLKVMVKIFGRKTPLELGFMDVEKE